VSFGANAKNVMEAALLGKSHAESVVLEAPMIVVDPKLPLAAVELSPFYITKFIVSAMNIIQSRLTFITSYIIAISVA